MAEEGLTADGFDRWYADMEGSPVKDEIQQRHLGLPAHLLSTSLLGWDGIAEVVAALRLPPGGTLLDLACGRGGYGLEVALRTGARLIGVDFSAVAVREAAAQGRRLGRSAQFRVGELADTGLAGGSVHGVLCVDAIQFARSTVDALAEMRRVLVPGGRVVLTGWEPVQPGDRRLPERIRSLALSPALRAAGFEQVEVLERPAWRVAERAMWQEAATLDPDDDPALQSFHEEGVQVLPGFDLTRRVLARATAPGGD